jgi:hypothetical protein
MCPGTTGMDVCGEVSDLANKCSGEMNIEWPFMYYLILFLDVFVRGCTHQSTSQDNT